MSRLALYLLGPPRIELDEQPVHIGRRKAVALLTYLGVMRGNHSRDVLATLLWPDYDQSSARGRLRRTLSTLSRTIGGQWLAADRETVCLNFKADIWIDVADFRQRLAASEAHVYATNEACPDCLSGLTEAVELYRDDFLAGFTLPDSLAFDEWQRYQTEGLRDELASALERLVGCLAARGDHKVALPHARRWLELDKLHEPAHRNLMELYGQSGRRSAALRQYRRCVRLLEQELGVSPSAETLAVYENVRADRESAVAVVTPSRSPKVLPGFLRADKCQAVTEKPVFVARERELTWLNDHLEAAIAGRGGVLFVTGGPGRGKTALMAEFVRQAMDRHPSLLAATGTCNAFSGVGDPYLPFSEVMGMLAGDVESRWAAGALSTEHARRLWAALPGVVAALLDHGPHLIEVLVPGEALLSRAQTHQTLGDCEQSSPESPRVSELTEWLQRRRLRSGSLGQERIFQQVADTLTALSSAHPLLLTLDDLQWVDTASATLLFHLGRHLAIAGGRVFILGAYRREELSFDRPSTDTGDRQRHPMQKVLSEFRRHFGDVWFDLSTADGQEGRTFVDAYLDNPASPFVCNRLGEDFRAALSKRTAGHPLFTIELLQEMHGRNELIQDADGLWISAAALDWETLPTRVEAAIQERIERLDNEARDLLTVASVEGETFTAQAVAHVQGLSEREVLRQLSQELGPRGHRLVREAEDVALDGGYLSRYRFGHALFQAYLYGCLSAGERRLLHGELADALEGLYGEHTDPIAGVLARQFEAAGELEKAAAYSERAAELASVAYARGTEIEHWRTSLRLHRQLGDRAGEAKILRWLAHCFGELLDFAESDALLQEALRIYRELGDSTGEAWALNQLGWSHVMAGNYTRAEPYLQKAVDISKQVGEPFVQARALCGLARFFREYTGDLQRVRACAEEALQVSREAGDPFNQALAGLIIGAVLHYQGDYSAAEPHMQRFLNTMYGNRAWVEHGALGRVHVGLNAIAVGDYSAALAHLEGSRSTFRDIGQQDLDDDAFAQSALSLVFHQTAIIRRRTTMRWVPWLSIAAQVTITARRPH